MDQTGRVKCGESFDAIYDFRRLRFDSLDCSDVFVQLSVFNILCFVYFLVGIFRFSRYNLQNMLRSKLTWLVVGI